MTIVRAVTTGGGVLLDNKDVDRIEDVNEDKEEGYKKSHSSGNNIRRDDETDPGNDHK